MVGNQGPAKKKLPKKNAKNSACVGALGTPKYDCGKDNGRSPAPVAAL